MYRGGYFYIRLESIKLKTILMSNNRECLSNAGQTHFMGWKELIKKTALYKEFPETWGLFRAQCEMKNTGFKVVYVVTSQLWKTFSH